MAIQAVGSKAAESASRERQHLKARCIPKSKIIGRVQATCPGLAVVAVMIIERTVFEVLQDGAAVQRAEGKVGIIPPYGCLVFHCCKFSSSLWYFNGLCEHCAVLSKRSLGQLQSMTRVRFSRGSNGMLQYRSPTLQHVHKCTSMHSRCAVSGTTCTQQHIAVAAATLASFCRASHNKCGRVCA